MYIHMYINAYVYIICNKKHIYICMVYACIVFVYINSMYVYQIHMIQTKEMKQLQSYMYNNNDSKSKNKNKKLKTLSNLLSTKLFMACR